MKESRSLIFGCGDVGRRIAKQLLANGTSPNLLTAYVNSQESAAKAANIGIACDIIDLDAPSELRLGACNGARLYYTIAPQKQGVVDKRSRAVIDAFGDQGIKPDKVVLISTTGVYGDSGGDWVDEQSLTQPQTERGQRRLDSEQHWLAWSQEQGVDVIVLRVPGIYAFSRLPRDRLKRQTPVVKPTECGFTNRIHADDLANICIVSMESSQTGEIYNATDGSPGTIAEYLQAAASALGYPPLPEISMKQAQSELSSGMLSYLNESRKISNRKLINKLGVKLLYPDFRKGILK